MEFFPPFIAVHPNGGIVPPLLTFHLNGGMGPPWGGSHSTIFIYSEIGRFLIGLSVRLIYSALFSLL